MRANLIGNSLEQSPIGRSNEGDWQGLYLNENLVVEGHSIPLSSALEKVANFANSIKTNAKFFSYKIDSDDLENIGGFPETYGDL